MEIRAKVLLTDSQDAQTRLCEEALEKAGVQVVRCERNGLKVLKMLEEERPDACLLDAVMPGLDAVSVKSRFEQEHAGEIVKPQRQKLYASGHSAVKALFGPL